MPYYHCSPTPGLTVLHPGKPSAFNKPTGVYLTTLLPMALMYSVRNYEYTYGYTKDGNIYFEEYFPNALEVLYRGKQASLYTCSPVDVRSTKIPNEVFCKTAVPILKETVIPDACEALLAQERAGNLMIRRYHEMTQRELEWIHRAEADHIRSHNLLAVNGSEAEYYRTHYPISWSMVEKDSQ